MSLFGHVTSVGVRVMAYVCFWMTLCLFLDMSEYRHKLCLNMDIRCPRHGTRALKSALAWNCFSRDRDNPVTQM
jgi:hypothetical protein